jgi:molybdopterin synthase sulfur carrier subunit
VPHITVTLPPALLALFPGAEARLLIDATSVQQVIDELDRRWPGMRDRLCDSRPALRRNINVFVDGRRVALTASLEGATRMEIMLAILG